MEKEKGCAAPAVSAHEKPATATVSAPFSADVAAAALPAVPLETTLKKVASKKSAFGAPVKKRTKKQPLSALGECDEPSLAARSPAAPKNEHNKLAAPLNKKHASSKTEKLKTPEPSSKEESPLSTRDSAQKAHGHRRRNCATIHPSSTFSMPKKESPSTDASGRQKALATAIDIINKQHGDGSLMRLGEHQKINIETIPTGSLSLDIALGGGLPKGRVIEIYGPESSGKTTLACHAVASVQKAGGQAAFVDAEHALDPEYAAKIGVDLESLLISQPDTGEQALDIVETLVRSGAVDVIVIDSVAALTPKAEIEGDMGGSLPGLQARLMSQALRKLTAIAHKSNTTLIFLNQIRMKIGVMFGNPETTTGGNALKFYSSVRLDIRRIGKIEHGSGDTKQVIGNATRVKVVKNKIAPPFRQAEFDIRYNQGIDHIADMLATGVKLGVIQKAGAFFDINGEKYQGLEKARAGLLADPKALSALEERVRTQAAGADALTGEVSSAEKE